MNKWVIGMVAFVAAALPALCRADDAKLAPNDLLAIIGDSITEQKIYSVYMEDYLLMCQPVEPIRTMQFGWGGETSWQFVARLRNDTLRFSPTVATTLYGMNDGGYSAQNPAKHASYYKNQTLIVTALKKAGVRLIVVGAPDTVDTYAFGDRRVHGAEAYNKTLADERDVAKQVATEQGVRFADVYDNMLDVMQKAKAKYGQTYLICGDGIHPLANGHLVIAYTFLKALGCDGNIGTISVDLGADTATATDGHKILSVKNGVVQVQSTRYPFCFDSDPKSPNFTAGILEFFPFNQDLNRFNLVVTNAKSAKLKVTWGKTSKIYSADELAKGVNLAADFLKNPFSARFAKVDQLVRQQQSYETPMIKEWMHSLPNFHRMMPDDRAELDKLSADATARDKALCAAAAAAATPVQNTITIETAQ